MQQVLAKPLSLSCSLTLSLSLSHSEERVARDLEYVALLRKCMSGTVDACARWQTHDAQILKEHGFVAYGYGHSPCWSSPAGSSQSLKAPLVLSKIEVIRISWFHGADGGAASLLHAVHQMLSLSFFVPARYPVTVSGAAGNNRGRVVERRLLARTQGRTADCTV